MRTAKVSMIILSHLSDFQELMGFGSFGKETKNRINFVKFLILKYPDTSVEIDADKEYELFRIGIAKVSPDEQKTLTDLFDNVSKELGEIYGEMIATTPGYSDMIIQSVKSQSDFSHEKIEAVLINWSNK